MFLPLLTSPRKTNIKNIKSKSFIFKKTVLHFCIFLCNNCFLFQLRTVQLLSLALVVELTLTRLNKKKIFIKDHNIECINNCILESVREFKILD